MSFRTDDEQLSEQYKKFVVGLKTGKILNWMLHQFIMMIIIIWHMIWCMVIIFTA